jgi:hypothetical protein
VRWQSVSVRKGAAAALLALLCAAAPSQAVSLELGITGGGGLALAYGSYLDSKAEAVAELGASQLTALGSSETRPFPGWTLGLYAQVDLLSWLALQMEVSYESAGALRVAMTRGGSPFDQYGISFASVTIPVRARAALPLGPGLITGALGPFVGIVAGDVSIVDRYSSATTTATITPDLSGRFFLGVQGGIGYSLPLGPGVAGIEIRSAVSFLPMSINGRSSDGDFNPVGLRLLVSYGIRLKEGARR